MLDCFTTVTSRKDSFLLLAVEAVITKLAAKVSLFRPYVLRVPVFIKRRNVGKE